MIGPYYTKNNKLAYVGNKLFKSLEEVRKVRPPSNLSKRHIEIRKDSQKWAAIIKIWDEIFRATSKFMEKKHVIAFDLPIITRMISSPGSLTGAIPSDVDPLEIRFFNKITFLTQSSQLYLEFAITNPEINSVYYWGKSFRREKADFRHLPEFTHIEFESNINFDKNLQLQKDYLQFLVNSLIENCKREIFVFLTEREITELDKFAKLEVFEKITFHDAFKLLKKKTKNSKYEKITIKNFGAYEEVLLTEIIKRPVFVTCYIGDEVAFYHATNPQNPKLVMNADFLFPGYGEIIGSGERVHTREEIKEKAKHFKLNMKDYQPYIESRSQRNSQIHSGWGMGVERFIQAILKLPFIWETKPFTRVDGQIHP